MANDNGIKHFIDLSTVPASELRSILDDAKARKARLKAGEIEKPYAGKVLAMIFEKPSTRTRVSFDVGMRQLGGETIMLTGSEMQLGRSETIADTAKVLSRYVDAIMIRTTSHDRMLELAEYATVPVINALTDDTHPCQIMADVLTYEEHRGSIQGKTFAWMGTATTFSIRWSRLRRVLTSTSISQRRKAANPSRNISIGRKRTALASCPPWTRKRRRRVRIAS